MQSRRLGRDIHALDNMIGRKVKNLKPFQYVESITGTNGWIIGYLATHMDQDVCQRDLEKEFSITRSTTSKVIKLMEQKGLIERQTMLQDARLKKLTPTRKALELHQEVVGEMDKIESELQKGFTEEELTHFVSFIERMKNNLK